MGLFGKLFGGRRPAPECTIHPDDFDLVSTADIEWWKKLSLQDCQALVQEDDIFRLGVLSQYTKVDGLSAEDAAKKVRRAYPFYYLTLEHRKNEKFSVGLDDARLPYVLKNRINRAVINQFIDPVRLDQASSMNALIRVLIRTGKI